MKPNAIDKALRLLDLLIGHPEGLRPVNLMQQTGFPPGTLHRLLGTLVRNGFVRQDPSSGRYVLGYKFLWAFNGLVKGLALPEKALPLLRRLARATGQAANLGILHGDQLVVLESVVSDNAGPVLYSPPGTLMPPNCTAMGKVLLAFLPDRELEQYLQTASLVRRTPHSLTTASELHSHLAQVRRNGYAVDDQEYNLGVRCIAGPVYDHTGRVIAAISVTSPIQDLPVERIPAVAEVVVAVARDLSADLGHDQSLSVSASSRTGPIARTAAKEGKTSPGSQSGIGGQSGMRG